MDLVIASFRGTLASRLLGSMVVDASRSCIDGCQSSARVASTTDAQGAAVTDTPEVLFVCVHNAGRSQMAAALLDHHANGRQRPG